MSIQSGNTPPKNVKPENMQRVNNFRMGAYAALAMGLINLQYQSGSDNNLMKSLVLVAPGGVVLAISFTEKGRSLFQSKIAAPLGITLGLLALAYSFLV